MGATALIVACAPTPAQKVEADLASIRKESDAKTMITRGKAFAAVGDHTRAEEYFVAGLDAGGDAREILPLLMDVCVRTGRYRSAIQHAENHLRNHPNDAQTRVMVAALYVAIDEGKQARAQLEHVVVPIKEPGAVDPNDADAGARVAAPAPTADVGGPKLRAQAHYLLAVVARDTEKDVVTADRHFREYLRIEPNGSHAEEAKASLLKRMP